MALTPGYENLKALLVEAESAIKLGNSLAFQWFGLRASTAGGMGLIPGWGTKILHAAWLAKRKKKNQASVYAAIPLT